MSVHTRKPLVAAIVATIHTLTLASAYGDTIWYVDQQALGPGSDGTSWCTAFDDLQDALEVAVYGDEIRVAEGVYTPDRGTSSRTESFVLRSGAIMLGGYAGCGAIDPDLRDPSLHETILSGDLNDNDTFITSEADCGANDGVWYEVLCDRVLNNEENSYHVVVSTNDAASTLLDGFTISGGNANGESFGPSPDSNEQGSGINVYHGMPTISNCVLENNRTDNHGALNDHGGATVVDCEFRHNYSINWGGAIHNQTDISTRITNTRFFENATQGANGGGGAVFVRGTIEITDSLFENNHARIAGGAIYQTPGSTPTLRDCTFTNNATIGLGGAVYNESSNARWEDCVFADNHTKYYGGAVYNLHADSTLLRCSFENNSNNHGSGGALYTFGGSPTITDCVFRNNSSGFPLGGSGGGAVLAGESAPRFTRCLFEGNSTLLYGGAILSYRGTPTFRDTLFLGNRAQRGGGAIMTDSDAIDFVNCAFVGNVAEYFDGGGALSTGGEMTLSCTNCAFVSNTTVGDGGGIKTIGGAHLDIVNSIFWSNVDQSEDTEGAQLYMHVLSTVAIDYSIVDGWSGSLGGAGNFGDDPMFIDPDGSDDILGTSDDNLQLMPGSPAIDRGDNTAISEDVLRDMENGTRRIDGDTNASVIVDIGPLEFGEDCNENGVLDVTDLDGGAIDVNANSVPDTCEMRTPVMIPDGSRYLQITIPEPRLPLPVAISLTSSDLPCLFQYVDLDPSAALSGSGRLVDLPVFRLPSEWGTMLVRDDAIVPETEYTAIAISSLDEFGIQSNSVQAATRPWGDVNGDGSADVRDLTLVVDLVADRPAPSASRNAADLFPCTPDGKIDARDLTWSVDTVKELPFPCPVACP